MPSKIYAGVTAQIVSAYASKHSVWAAHLPDLIACVHAALSGLRKTAEPAGNVEKPTPAQIKNSITPDALISFIDAKPYKTLKRHLTRHGLSMQDYRARYGLPVDYPATAPNFSARRSELARALGLGHQRRKSAGSSAPSSEPKGRRKAKGAGQAEA
ncbi:MucR family transcriptional regulator [Methylobacterium nigriterrae]|uniref:MucR family transcriptional regulator n=1 Tax=Methylobacterium nigriterrae TaxID=3127512 RepID=UPI0030138F10